MESRKRRRQKGKRSTVKRNFARATDFREHICFCLQENPESPIKRLDCCRQRTHETCLSRWLEQTNSCPFCRAPIHRTLNEITDPVTFIFAPEFDRVQFLRDFYPYDDIPPPFASAITNLYVLENIEEWQNILPSYYSP